MQATGVSVSFAAVTASRPNSGTTSTAGTSATSGSGASASTSTNSAAPAGLPLPGLPTHASAHAAGGLSSHSRHPADATAAASAGVSGEGACGDDGGGVMRFGGDGTLAQLEVDVPSPARMRQIFMRVQHVNLNDEKVGGGRQLCSAGKGHVHVCACESRRAIFSVLSASGKNALLIAVCYVYPLSAAMRRVMVPAGHMNGGASPERGRPKALP